MDGDEYQVPESDLPARACEFIMRQADKIEVLEAKIKTCLWDLRQIEKYHKHKDFHVDVAVQTAIEKLEKASSR